MVNELPIIFPMGAKTDEKRTLMAWDNPNWVCERKYDGSRYLCRIEHDGKVRFVSRQKSKSNGLPVDKTENVPHLVEFFKYYPAGTIFDGEIITHENCTSSEVTSIMGSLPERAIELQSKNGYVKYVIFDLLFYNGKDFRSYPYELRRMTLEEMFKHKNEYVFLAPVVKENKKEFFKTVVQSGGEGVILKNIHKPYIDNKKPTDTWIKVKKHDTFDVVVIGYTKPTKEYTGKQIEKWEYWEGPQGNKIMATDLLSNRLLDDGWVPITRDYYNGWIGAVRFAQWFPELEYIKRRKQNKIPEAIEKLEINGITHYLVEIGQTDGLSDKWKQEFTEKQDYYLGKVIEVEGMEQLTTTGAIRHPAFKQLREDKDSKECIFNLY